MVKSKKPKTSKDGDNESLDFRPMVSDDGKGIDIKKVTPLVGTVQAARNVFTRLRDDHRARQEQYAMIKGLIAGNAPYNQVELEQNGMGHRANFNDLTARCLAERSALPYWNLYSQSENIVKFSLHVKDSAAPGFAEIMSRNLDKVLRLWPSFNFRYNRIVWQLMHYGVSPVIWPDERDWRFRNVELDKFYIPDQASGDMELLTYLFMDTTVTVQYLFQCYEEYKDTDDDESPWNTEELENLLYHIINSKSGTMENKFSNYVEMQAAIQNKSLNIDNHIYDEVHLVTFIQKEMDDMYSVYMFHDYGGTPQEDFLYYSGSQYKRLTDFLVLFTSSPGEETVHSNRGVGHKMLSASMAIASMKCAITDLAFMASTPLLRGLATQDKDHIKFIAGVPTHIGTADFVQTNFGTNLNPLVGASTYLAQSLESNLLNSGDHPDRQDGVSGSANPSQARMMAFREHGVLKHGVNHFYLALDQVVRNIVVRMLNCKKEDPGYEYSQEWKESCIEDGVPPEIFEMAKDEKKINKLTGMPRMLSAKASRVSGDGSTTARIMALQELNELTGGNIGGPRQVADFTRQAVIATLGADYLETYRPENQEADESAGGASLAGVENAIMQQGQSPIFSPDNEHRSHLVSHLALGMETIRQVQEEEIDVVQADKIFNVLVPHINPHFQQLANSPFARDIVERTQEAISQLNRYAELNRANAQRSLEAERERIQRAQEQDAEAMSDAERKDFVAQRDEARKDAKVQDQLKRSDEASRTRAEIMRTDVERKAQNQRVKTVLDANNKLVEIEADARLDEIKETRAAMRGNTPSTVDFEG